MSSCSRSLADHIFRLLYSLFIVDERRADESSGFHTVFFREIVFMAVRNMASARRRIANRLGLRARLYSRPRQFGHQLMVKAGWLRENWKKKKNIRNVRHPVVRHRTFASVWQSINYFGSILKCLTFSICSFFSVFLLSSFFYVGQVVRSLSLEL